MLGINSAIDRESNLHDIFIAINLSRQLTTTFQRTRCSSMLVGLSNLELKALHNPEHVVFISETSLTGQSWREIADFHLTIQ